MSDESDESETNLPETRGDAALEEAVHSRDGLVLLYVPASQVKRIEAAVRTIHSHGVRTTSSQLGPDGLTRANIRVITAFMAEAIGATLVAAGTIED